jgi:hypothetical protein
MQLKGSTWLCTFSRKQVISDDHNHSGSSMTPELPGFLTWMLLSCSSLSGAGITSG